MIKLCPFNQRYRCNIWINNEVLRYTQEENEDLFRANWQEIRYLLNRIRVLEDYINSIGGEIPPEYPDSDE